MTSKPAADTRKYWIAGTILALGAGAFVRFVAVGFAPTARAITSAVGILISILGLYVIAWGTRNKYRQRASEQAPEGAEAERVDPQGPSAADPEPPRT